MVRPERVWALLAPWVSPDEATLERAACYRFQSIVARPWRLGRLLLAGDAAHQTPPFLGQGMCAGIRDVANLAWKLARVLRGKDDDALLDSYETERAPHVREYIARAVRLGGLINTKAMQAAKTYDGASPLLLASQLGHVEVVRALLAANADVDARSAKGATPLIVGAADGHLDVVQDTPIAYPTA